ncbi:MAG: ester cyclase [Haloarculaceae archaeon]
MALIPRARPGRRINAFRKQVFDAHDVDAIDRFLAPDAVVHGVAPGVDDRAGYARTMGRYFEAFPDFHAEHEAVLVRGDTAVTRWTVTGTHTGPLRFVGPDGHEYELGPTGREVCVSGFDMYRFEGGQIAELWQRYDSFDLLGQLGLLSLDGLRHVPELVRSRFAPSA